MNSDDILFTTAIYYFYIIGTIFFIHSLLYLRNAIKSVKWTKCTGKILKSTVHIKDFVMIYSPKIKYKYSFDNKQYYANRVLWGFPIETRKFTNNISKTLADFYKIDDIITIYVHPTKPKISVIEAGIKWQTLFYISIGVFFIIIAIVIQFIIYPFSI